MIQSFDIYFVEQTIKLSVVLDVHLSCDFDVFQ